MKHHLQYNWWKYLLVALVPTILWCSIFSSLKAPAPQERIHILYVGANMDTQKLEQDLAATLPALTDQPLKAITVEATEEIPSYSTLDVRCFDYDILIFEKSSMPENVGQAVFVRLTESLLAQFPEAAYYQEDVADAGVLTYGFSIAPGSNLHLAKYYTGTEQCYLFISPRSVNFDTLNENGSAGNDGALKAVQYLLEKKQ